MSFTFGFYNSLNGDRKYYAEQMSQIFDGVITDGVFENIGTFLSVVPTATPSMNVLVKAGRAWFDHTWSYNDSDYTLSIQPADIQYSRIDAVVLEVNSDDAVRENSLKVLTGTPAPTPVAPTLTNTVTVHQHVLAYITVPANATSITASNIQIRVGTSETPFVTAILETTNIDVLFASWTEQFETWFANIQAQLAGDVASNLQNQITQNYERTLNAATKTLMGLSASATPSDAFAKLQNLVNGKANIATGSYVGTGTYGVNNPCTLTFPFIPKAIMMYALYIRDSDGQVGLYETDFFVLPYVKEMKSFCHERTSSGYWWERMQWSGATLQWISFSSDTQQWNVSGKTYCWIAMV